MIYVVKLPIIRSGSTTRGRDGAGIERLDSPQTDFYLRVSAKIFHLAIIPFATRVHQRVLQQNPVIAFHVVCDRDKLPLEIRER